MRLPFLFCRYEIYNLTSAPPTSVSGRHLDAPHLSTPFSTYSYSRLCREYPNLYSFPLLYRPFLAQGLRCCPLTALDKSNPRQRVNHSILLSKSRPAIP